MDGVVLWEEEVECETKKEKILRGRTTVCREWKVETRRQQSKDRQIMT